MLGDCAETAGPFGSFPSHRLSRRARSEDWIPLGSTTGMAERIDRSPNPDRGFPASADRLLPTANRPPIVLGFAERENSEDRGQGERFTRNLDTLDTAPGAGSIPQVAARARTIASTDATSAPSPGGSTPGWRGAEARASVGGRLTPAGTPVEAMWESAVGTHRPGRGSTRRPVVETRRVCCPHPSRGC